MEHISVYKPRQRCAEKKPAAFFQPKLTINSPNDVYEQEADAMAEKIMHSPGNFKTANGFVQPRNLPVQRKCTECEEEKEVHRKESASSTTSFSPLVESYINNLNGSGKYLSKAERNFFEPSFNYDFSQVRLHTDSRANDSADSINAHAYTQGNNIVFASNQYSPATDDGKKLMAHELTHVLQQSGSVSSGIQRQPGEVKKKPSSDISKELEKDSLFQKLEKKIKDKIKEEIDNAPETITKAVLDKIIDTFAPPEYKEGLKKVGEAIIKVITNKKPVSTSVCTAIPGYHEGGSTDFKGQCCRGNSESLETCCPVDRFAPNEEFSNCCKPGEVVDSLGKCMKPTPVDPTTICVSPGKKDSLGKCCFPPLQVIDGICSQPQKPDPTPPPLNLSFTAGIIDDYNIDQSVINSRQQKHFNEVKKQLAGFIETCPASVITIYGFTDKPGTEDHNMGLGQRRADHMKFLLQLELVKVKTPGMMPIIFTNSKGESSPADVGAGEKFSAANRRVEIKLNSLCPPLGSPDFKLLTDTPLRLGL